MIKWSANDRTGKVKGFDVYDGCKNICGGKLVYTTLRSLSHSLCAPKLNVVEKYIIVIVSSCEDKINSFS